MGILESIKIALSSLKANKMRSVLTMLGIIIGVGSVIAVVAIGQSGEAVLKSQFTGESDTIELYYTPSEEEIEQDSDIFLEDAFTQEDIRLIEDIPTIEKVIATSSENTSIRHVQETSDASVMGINQAYLNMQELHIAKGRNLRAADFLGGSRVAVVNEGMKDELFDDNNESLIGEIIYVGDQPVKIIGSIEQESDIFDLSADTVYVPMKTWQNIFSKKSITEVSIESYEPDELQEAGQKAADVLNSTHETDEAYKIMNVEEMAEGISKVTRIMTIIIGSIAGVSLLVGGIGVMNIMLVSVTERTREIGVRMSLGATRRQILFQFLVEAITLTLIGGLIGMGPGIGIAVLVSHFAGWPSLVPIPVIIGGILFSMLIGIVFGLLPANKASRLDPIEALRYE